MHYRYLKKYSIGFTLIELIVTIAIAGIMMSIAIPSFTQTIRNSRLTTNINQLVTSLNLARSEAIKRGQPVTVLRTGGGTGVWEQGWTVFTDLDGDGVQEDNGALDDDILIRVYSALPNNFTLRASGKDKNDNIVDIDNVTFQSSGISNNSNVINFVLCENSDGNNIPEANTSRLVLINMVGRVRMGDDADNNGIQENKDGTEITSCTVSPFI